MSNLNMKSHEVDPFWERNSKLTIEEIERIFDPKTAAILKLMKVQNEKSEMRSPEVDPFWERNSKLTIHEIEKYFDPRTAAILKLMKAQNQKSE